MSPYDIRMIVLGLYYISTRIIYLDEVLSSNAFTHPYGSKNC